MPEWVGLGLLDADFHVLQTNNIREEGNVPTGEVYVAVKLTITCEFTAPQEAEEGQRKSGPENDCINIDRVTGGEEFKNALEEKRVMGRRLRLDSTWIAQEFV